MSSIQLKFRPSSFEKKEGTLFYQVTHNRLVRRFHTAYKLFPPEWDEKNKEIIIPPDLADDRLRYLLDLKNTVQADGKLIKNIISYLDRTASTYTAEDIVVKYQTEADNFCFISFARTLISRLRQLGRHCTADTYTTSVNSFGRFRRSIDVSMDEVDADLMTAYQTYLKSIEVCPNSISYYMRNLRAIYNRAVDKDLTVQRYPFRQVYTGIEKTVKRAVTLDIVRQIRDLDLRSCPDLDYARDIFMFSFYTRGMSFVDIAFLKKEDLQNGILSYRRHKTGQRLWIKWEKPMQQLVDKYDTKGSPFLLPIIKSPGQDERKQYKSEAHKVNRALKKIGKQLGLSISLTTYVARHGWASIAKSKNIPISTISEAMGHDSETTTRIYLASLDTSIVDKANSLILKSL